MAFESISTSKEWSGKCDRRALERKIKDPLAAELIFCDMQKQAFEDQFYNSPAKDVATEHSDTLDQKAYKAYVTTSEFINKDIIKISDNLVVVPYVFKKANKQKRRFRFFVLGVGNYDAIQFYMPVWAFFKKEPFEYDSISTRNYEKDGRFRVFIREGDVLQELPAVWKISENTCQIVTSQFKAILHYDPLKEDGSVIFIDLKDGVIMDKGKIAAKFEAASDKEVFKMLVDARKSTGLSQKEVANRMNVSQSIVGRLEKGRTTPTYTTLKKYAAAIGADLKISFSIGL